MQLTLRRVQLKLSKLTKSKARAAQVEARAAQAKLTKAKAHAAQAEARAAQAKQVY